MSGALSQASQAAARGIEIARHALLLGADTAVAAPGDRLPFEQSGATAHLERWRELGWHMRQHEQSADPELARLRDQFGLAPVEYWLVMMCAAVERYPEAAAAAGILMDLNHAHLITPLALAQVLHAARGISVEDSLRAALGGGTPALVGLLEAADIAPAKPLSHQTLRLSVAELRHVLSDSQAPRSEPHPLPARREVCADPGVLDATSALLDQARIVVLRGPSPRAVRQFAADLAVWIETSLQLYPGVESNFDLTPLLRLRHVLPALDLTGSAQAPGPLRAALAAARDRVPRLLILAGDHFGESEFPTVYVPRIGHQQALRIWAAATGDAAMAARLASRFRVNAEEAAAAVRQAAADGEAAISAQVLEQGGQRMGRMAVRLRSEATLADLVVPAEIGAQIEDIAGWQRNTSRVFGEMGLGRRSPLGRGLTCLFSGPPGTGKTFAAQCLANELGLNLFRIDLSQVVSKYIGETEKALGTVFDEAEAGHCMLLFDEADALFGKRSEVKDAHDRYANIEVGYLLQRIEAFEGVAVLATNLRSNVDPAFIRRIRFLLDFPMPDAAGRRRLWEQALPGPAHRATNLDIEPFVERFRLSGGSIQNIGLAAAHMAAASHDCVVTVEQLVRATYRELEKSGQSRDRLSFGALADFLPVEVA